MRQKSFEFIDGSVYRIYNITNIQHVINAKITLDLITEFLIQRNKCDDDVMRGDARDAVFSN